MKFKIVITGIIAALLTSCSVFDDGYHKVIKNTKQFLQIPDDSDSNYILGADLDFSGVTFSPKRFRGRLDGNGHVISNLTITSSEDYVGIFSKCTGTVSNLTIKNVTVNAPQCDYVGVISGSGGTFTNCKVIFGTTSSVTGNHYVGGISGGSAELTACSVISDATGAVVRGSKYIGGLLGGGDADIDADITSCSVDAVVAGSDDVGGITGTINGTMSIENCYFHGKAMGENNVGGIAGYDYSYRNHQIRGCKVDADITATDNYAGGVIGRCIGYTQVIGCYTKGTVVSDGYCGGLAGYEGYAYLSYSTMTSSSSEFYGLGYSMRLKDCATVRARASGTNVKINCTDITTFLRDCYSEYADYWNYEDTWLYNGTVSCPKLAWESSFEQSQLEDTNPWNGNKASAFSSGTGTLWDPYIITTGGQLLLAKDYSGKYFALGGNIDLNNKNWLPFVFNGTLDGKGYIISNLHINRIDDCQGLFSTCSGKISDLTIKNVKIDALQADYVGVISGSGGTFTNCKVIFGTTSSVTGNNYVGGISGGSAKLTACSVISDATGAVVRGSKYIGGLLGGGDADIDADITSCSVDAVVAGSDDVGGIIGTINGTMSIENCYFHGKAMGENNVGGIAGYDYSYRNHQIRGCKVDADITATDNYAGGVIGRSIGYTQVIGCYTKGTVVSDGYCGGLAGYEGYAYLSYSTMTSSSSEFYGLGYSMRLKDCATVRERACSSTETNVVAGCKDITSFLRDCYSEYAEYWNFNNTWRYNGTVSCPKLAWEK